MLDEQRIEGDPVAPVEEFAEPGLGLLGPVRADDPQPIRDAVDVGVDRDRRDPVREDEHAVRGLRADPRQRGQLVERRRDRPPEPVEERARAVPDRARLDVVESGPTDQGFDRPGRGAGERRGVGVAGEQARRRDIGVLVARALGEDRSDQDLKRVLGVVA